MKKLKIAVCLFLVTAQMTGGLIGGANKTVHAFENNMVQVQETSKDQNMARTADEMTSRELDYEKQGEKVIQVLESGDFSSESVKTNLTFQTLNEAVSFGKYFYRYLYLGREEIWLAVESREDSHVIYVSCDDPKEAARQHRQVEKLLDSVIESSAGMSEKEKAEFYYDWVYERITYDYSLERKTLYDGVIDGESVCWGYVLAYLYLCRNSGLVCEPVYRGNHAWNKVMIDGQWRYCDITWDKCEGGNRWKFLTQEEMDSDKLHNDL